MIGLAERTISECSAFRGLDVRDGDIIEGFTVDSSKGVDLAGVYALNGERWEYFTWNRIAWLGMALRNGQWVSVEVGEA